MFGYVRAYKPEMKFKDCDLYHGVYCSLCKEVGRRYGLVARNTLSYDFTFFVILRMAVRNSCVNFEKSHCSFNPAKKCLDCGLGNIDLEYTADVSMLTVYFKLKDNIDDIHSAKRIFLKSLMPYANHIYKKAAERRPEQAEIIQNIMSKQAELEKRNVCLDEAADQSAKLIAELLSSDIECDDIQSLKDMGYYIGRWVYLIDAVDDCEDDIKSKGFNPLKERFGSEDYNEYCEKMLNLTMGEAVEAYNKLKVYRFNDIIQNILYYGTYNVMKKVIAKEALK